MNDKNKQDKINRKTKDEDQVGCIRGWWRIREKRKSRTGTEMTRDADNKVKLKLNKTGNTIYEHISHMLNCHYYRFE